MNSTEKEDGAVPPSSTQPQPPPGPKFKAYKLLLDPCLCKGATKLYRFDGVVPDDPTYPPVICRDPRTTLSLSRSWNRQDGLELPVPRFRIDGDYVGEPPPVEVSISNLNDNVDRAFLFDLLQKFGLTEEVHIYYHPLTGRHLGIARILFVEKTASRACVAKLHNSPLMGNILNVFFDPFGLKVKEMFEELTIEKKVEPPPKVVEEKKEDGKSKHAHSKRHHPPSTPKPPPAPSIQVPPGTPLNPPATPAQLPPPQTPSQTPGQAQISASSIYPVGSVPPYGMPPPQYVPYNVAAPVVTMSYQTPYNSFPSTTGENMSSLPPPPPPKGTDSETADSIKVNSQENSNVCHTPPSKPINLNEQKSLEREDFDEDLDEESPSPKMDLDTRIKLLLKSNKSTPFGKFLNFSMSDSEEEESETKGRFRGGFTIRKRKSLCISRSEIWRSENSDVEMSPPRGKTRRRSGDFSPPPSPFLEQKNPGEWKPINGIVQQFRLSDLDQVSEDSEIELPSDRKGLDGNLSIQLPPEPMGGNGQDGFHPGNNSYPNQYFPSSAEPYSQQVNATYGLYPPQFYQPPPHSIPHWTNQTTQFEYSQQINYSNQVPYFNTQFEPPPPPPPPQFPPISPQTELRNTTKEMSMSVLDQLTKDLRQILKRDCEKRLIEATSFKLFETWCDDQLRQYKELKEQRDRENKKAAEEKMNGKLEMTITEDALSGFGFRSIPKLPSFKIHKKVIPPPVEEPVKEEPTPQTTPPEEEPEEEPEDEDNGDSDLEIEHKRRPVRRLTLSSDSEGLGYSSDEGQLQPPSPNKSKDHKKNKHLKDLWTESISEESFSPKGIVLPGVGSVKEEIKEGEAEENIRKQLALDKKIEQVLSSPLRPPSPERVSADGPYIHTYDHNYAKPFGAIRQLTPPISVVQPLPPVLELKPLVDPLKMVPKVKGVVKNQRSLGRQGVKPMKNIVSFEIRDEEESRKILTEFLFTGVDMEDLIYFKTCYENMKKDPAQAWITRTHWSDHQPTKILERKKKSKRRVHVTGSARTEGFYHLDEDEKRRHKMQWANVMTVEYNAPGTAGAVGVTALAQEKHHGKTQIEKSREARSQQRRILTALGTEVTSTSDLLKFNQLKFRKKNLCFRRSTIHDWGLFAAEPIAADEMVIEYVGQTIRPYLADVREQKYEKQGIGSSYLFRIDLENIIDATKCGNLSRFINHSCNPNCYAKVITIQGEKKIVIYSKEAIAVNEEITYDYKFPIEEKKIICLCGTPQCRGTLN